MILQSPAAPGAVSLNLIEGGLTAIAFGLAFAWPRIANSWFSRVERAFGRLARKKGLAVAVVGFSAILLRLAILPLWPIPLPFVPDDFSFLLAADTFLHGRLANPTPAMWVHFESIHIDMRPTYGSMYFPAQGLLMALGKLLFGHPWFGILLATGLMCAAICWMLQAWLPPSWALLGGFLAVLRLGLFTYWINTYTGGAPIAALAGALVLGACPRLIRTGRFRYGLLLSIGIALLVLTRPYEGMLLCLPVAFVLGRWILFGKNRPSPAVLLRRAAVPVALLVATAAWLCYYDYRSFGSPTTLPYKVNRTTYAVAPYYVWQSPRPFPVYHHPILREFYTNMEMRGVDKMRTLTGYPPQTVLKATIGLLFFAGFALMPPLLMVRRVFLDRRIRFIVIGILVLAAGMAIEIYLIPHYLAPFTASFYAFGLQAMRHLRVWKPGGQPAGAAIVRLIVVLCLLMAGVRLFSKQLNLKVAEYPASEWTVWWFGPDYFGTERAAVESALEKLPGKQLAIVREGQGHYPLNEWVYNGAEIDSAKVVWAREMDAADNLELTRYYGDRKAWLVEPDASPARISPFPAADTTPAGSP